MTTTATMMRPTVHIGGTAQSELLDAHCTAMNAIRDAITAMEDVAPNGRDFYPQGPDAIYAAGREHFARVDKLRDVLADLELLAEHIADA